LTRLSVNINKIATLRNARGGNVPDVVEHALAIERYGAHGITVHPRPDERHIRRSDVRALAPLLSTEFNIEGYPSKEFIALVLEVRPAQVTLVPDPPGVLTSDTGWDARKNLQFLKSTIAIFKQEGIRTSIFMGTELDQIAFAAESGTDRIELYTGPYAHDFAADREGAVVPFTKAAEKAAEAGLGLNAGHDLDLRNLSFFQKNVPGLLEVSIGHALISDALTFGLENTVQLYLRELMVHVDKPKAI
jgi:pyridoxine 5-phosphate synthase